MPEQDQKNAPLENELLSRIAAGDESSFKILFNKYKNRIFGYALTVTQSHHRAEEITQELFIKLWTSRHLLAHVEDVDKYLFGMARFRTISFLRESIAAEKKLAGIQSEAAAVKDLAANQVETRILDQEYLNILNTAISSLSPQRRQVYLMSREGDMSLDEIASELNLSRNTVKNHLVEALKQIRLILNKHGIRSVFIAALLSASLKMIVGY